MARPGSTFGSTIGVMSVMAVTGIILVLFVLGHMAGNLQVFAGAETLNAYAAFLQGLGGGLWLIRIVLLAVFALHIRSALMVGRASNAARPVPYQVRKDTCTTFAARTMWVSGILVALFVVYHVLHFTTGTIDPVDARGGVDAEGRHDVYGMVVKSFQHLPTTAVYVVAQLVLALHLSHGVSSMVQTLGLRSARNAGLVKAAGPLVGGVVLVGNLSIPLAILAGLVK